MPVLNLGVVEVAYSDETEPRDPSRARLTKKGHVHKQDARRIERWMKGQTDDQPATTVTVAEALEEKYHVLETYVEHHKDDIGQAINNSLEGALENLHMGAPMGDPYAEAGQEIASGFRTFLLTAEMEQMGIDGVPTQAALDRESLRFKAKHGNEQRPSFVDTGTYEAAMRAWIES